MFAEEAQELITNSGGVVVDAAAKKDEYSERQQTETKEEIYIDHPPRCHIL
jgi:hypothetical protein